MGHQRWHMPASQPLNKSVILARLGAPQPRGVHKADSRTTREVRHIREVSGVVVDPKAVLPRHSARLLKRNVAQKKRVGDGLDAVFGLINANLKVSSLTVTNLCGQGDS